MKKTTSIFAILVVAMSFFAMSFTKDRSSLLGISNKIAAVAETSKDMEDVSLITSIIHLTPVLTNTQTVKCAITLYICQEPVVCWREGSV